MVFGPGRVRRLRRRVKEALDRSAGLIRHIDEALRRAQGHQEALDESQLAVLDRACAELREYREAQQRLGDFARMRRWKPR